MLIWRAKTKKCFAALAVAELGDACEVIIGNGKVLVNLVRNSTEIDLAVQWRFNRTGGGKLNINFFEPKLGKYRQHQRLPKILLLLFLVYIFMFLQKYNF